MLTLRFLVNSVDWLRKKGLFDVFLKFVHYLDKNKKIDSDLDGFFKFDLKKIINNILV